tara:strand:- start:335 stop:592 length:258 start_codon:yes stop_codon:yes gene_type:complete
MNLINIINENTNTINKKLSDLSDKNPTLSKIWLNYFTKHTILYKKVLNDVDKFLGKMSNNDFDNMNERAILILYLILNNDININN